MTQLWQQSAKLSLNTLRSKQHTHAHAHAQHFQISMFCRESGTGDDNAGEITPGLSEDELITQTVENFVFDLLERYS